MRDIEKMYFQIFVAEEQGFLWWRDGNSLDNQLSMRCVCMCLALYLLDLAAIML